MLIRPDGDQGLVLGLVLMNGLSTANLQTLKNVGSVRLRWLMPKGGSYQAWVRLSWKLLEERLRELAGSGLHNEIGPSSGWRLARRTVALSDSSIAVDVGGPQ